MFKNFYFILIICFNFYDSDSITKKTNQKILKKNDFFNIRNNEEKLPIKIFVEKLTRLNNNIVNESENFILIKNNDDQIIENKFVRNENYLGLNNSHTVNQIISSDNKDNKFFQNFNKHRKKYFSCKNKKKSNKNLIKNLNNCGTKILDEEEKNQNLNFFIENLIEINSENNSSILNKNEIRLNEKIQKLKIEENFSSNYLNTEFKIEQINNLENYKKLGNYFIGKNKTKKFFEVFYRKNIFNNNLIDILINENFEEYEKEIEYQTKKNNEKTFEILLNVFNNSLTYIIGILKQIKISDSLPDFGESFINLCDKKNIFNKNSKFDENKIIEKKDFLKSIKNITNYSLYMIDDLINYFSYNIINYNNKNTENETNKYKIQIKKNKTKLDKIISFSFDILKFFITCNENKSECITPILILDDRLKNCIISTNEKSLKKILLNFISNSIKFTKYGNIKFIAELNNLENEIILSIEDEGMGIKSEEQKFIFNPENYYQYNQTKLNSYNYYNQKGLCKSYYLAKDLEHKICFSSILGKGSKFSVIISLKENNNLNNREIIPNLENLKLNKKNEKIQTLIEENSNILKEENFPILVNKEFKKSKRGSTHKNLTSKYYKILNILTEIDYDYLNHTKLVGCKTDSFELEKIIRINLKENKKLIRGKQSLFNPSNSNINFFSEKILNSTLKYNENNPLRLKNINNSKKNINRFPIIQSKDNFIRDSIENMSDFSNTTKINESIIKIDKKKLNEILLSGKDEKLKKIKCLLSNLEINNSIHSNRNLSDTKKIFNGDENKNASNKEINETLIILKNQILKKSTILNSENNIIEIKKKENNKIFSKIEKENVSKLDIYLEVENSIITQQKNYSQKTLSESESNRYLIKNEDHDLKFLIVSNNKFLKNTMINNLNKAFDLYDMNIKYSIIEGNDGLNILDYIIKDQEKNQIKIVFSEEHLEYIHGSFAYEIISDLEKMQKILKINKVLVTTYKEKFTEEYLLKCGVDQLFYNTFSKYDILTILKDLKI